ncbi:MAG: hypothetical protein H0V53_09520 [Rubrobacter sp.]|nr:hypothetical protein [Rubrobacter sp.]
MRRINLLPPEERRRGGGLQAPGGLLGGLLISGAVVLVLMVGIYLLFSARLSNLEDEIAGLDGQITQQNQRLAELAPFRDLQASLDAKKPVADGIFRSRFLWDEFLEGLSFVTPETTSLDSFVGEASPVNLDAPVEETLDPPGSITFSGVAVTTDPETGNDGTTGGYVNVADFVLRMNSLRFLANSELTSAELDRETFEEPAINFEVTSRLVTTVGEDGEEVRLNGAGGDAADEPPGDAPPEAPTPEAPEPGGPQPGGPQPGGPQPGGPQPGAPPEEQGDPEVARAERLGDRPR